MKSHFLVEDNVAHELTFRHLFWRLWPFLVNYKLRVLTIVFLVLVYTVVGRSLPIMFGYAVDHGIKTGHHQVIIWTATLFFIFQLLRAGLSFGQSVVIQNLGNLVLFAIREKLIRHVQNLPASYFDQTSSGRVMTRVTNDVHSLGELFSQGLAVIFINLAEIFTILVTLALVSWPLTVVVLLLIPPLLWACDRLSRAIRVQFGAAKRRLAMINSFTAESIQGMKVVQLFHQSQTTAESFNRLSGEYKNLQLKTVRLFATLWPVIEAFHSGTIVMTLLVGAFFRKDLNLSPGQLAAYVLLVQGFFRPLRGILEKYNQLQNSLASADRVFQMLDVKPEDRGGSKLVPDKIRGKIEFKNVSFSYSEKAPFVIRDFCLSIAPGESVALVGRTGSGKSTLISLMQRLYTPTKGEIFLDGQPLSYFAVQNLRGRLGVVLQDNFIFRGTLADNISLSNPKISRSQILKSLQLAHCEKWIESRAGGLDVWVEERGANLSVGEKQLIAFARVLAFDPDILILDEATAHIDSVHETLIQQAIREVMKGKTSLIVAHRLSTILHCDRIVLLGEGQILEQGSHKELMLKKGRYWELYTSQTRIHEYGILKNDASDNIYSTPTDDQKI